MQSHWGLSRKYVPYGRQRKWLQTFGFSAEISEIVTICRKVLAGRRYARPRMFRNKSSNSKISGQPNFQATHNMTGVSFAKLHNFTGKKGVSWNH